MAENNDNVEEKTKKERVIDLLNKGTTTQKQIAETVGMSESRVSEIASEISIPEGARPFLTEEEATFLQEATPNQMKRRLTALMLERRGKSLPGMKLPPVTGDEEPAPSRSKPRGGSSYLEALNDQLERLTSIQVAAKHLQVDPTVLLRATGPDATDNMIDKMLTDTMKQYRLRFLTNELKNLERGETGAADVTIKAPAGVSLEEVRQLIKDDAAARDAVSEKRKLEDQLNEATHRHEILDQRLNAFLQLEKQAGSRDMTPQAVAELMTAKIEAATANLEKDFTGKQVDEIRGRLQQLETQGGTGKKSFMDEIAEGLEPKLREKLGEMIDKGFMSKEEIVDQKTGKTDWGKVITKALEFGIKTVEKAGQAPPPERRISELQAALAPGANRLGAGPLVDPLTGLPVKELPNPVAASGGMAVSSASLINNPEPNPTKSATDARAKTIFATGVTTVTEGTAEPASSNGRRAENKTPGDVTRKGNARSSRNARRPVPRKETKPVGEARSPPG